MNEQTRELLSAVKTGSVSDIQKALHSGADVNAADAGGYSPLMLAVERGLVACVEALIDGGADINYIAENSFAGRTTALKHACYLGHFDMVKQLAKHGGDIHYVDDNGSNLLFWACASRSEDRRMLVDYLIDQGVDINHQNSLGSTALMVVNYPGPFDADLFLMMMERGADPSLENIMGHNVEHLVHKMGRQSLVNFRANFTGESQ